MWLSIVLFGTMSLFLLVRKQRETAFYQLLNALKMNTQWQEFFVYPLTENTVKKSMKIDNDQL